MNSERNYFGDVINNLVQVQEMLTKNNSILEKERNYYKNQVINILSGLKKSKKAATLPKLPYGQSLSDDEFISLLEKCVEYSNYHLKKVLPLTL